MSHIIIYDMKEIQNCIERISNIFEIFRQVHTERDVSPS